MGVPGQSLDLYSLRGSPGFPFTPGWPPYVDLTVEDVFTCPPGTGGIDEPLFFHSYGDDIHPSDIPIAQGTIPFLVKGKYIEVQQTTPWSSPPEHSSVNGYGYPSFQTVKLGSDRAISFIYYKDDYEQDPPVRSTTVFAEVAYLAIPDDTSFTMGGAHPLNLLDINTEFYGHVSTSGNFLWTDPQIRTAVCGSHLYLIVYQSQIYGGQPDYYTHLKFWIYEVIISGTSVSMELRAEVGKQIGTDYGFGLGVFPMYVFGAGERIWFGLLQHADVNGTWSIDTRTWIPTKITDYDLGTVERFVQLADGSVFTFSYFHGSNGPLIPILFPATGDARIIEVNLDATQKTYSKVAVKNLSGSKSRLLLAPPYATPGAELLLVDIEGTTFTTVKEVPLTFDNDVIEMNSLGKYWWILAYSTGHYSFVDILLGEGLEPALRLSQRNDGLGPFAHPRLSTAPGGTPSSVQRSTTPKLGNNNHYR